MRHCDVLIAGGGMAGMMCALMLPEHLQVTVLSKAPLPTGSTHLAQGGIAAVSSRDDSPEMHLRDTVRAGAGLVDEAAAMAVILKGGLLIETLRQLGIPLEGAGNGVAGIEGGHSFRRVLHYYDRTGRMISRRLTQSARSRKNITIIEGAFAINLITASREAPATAPGEGDRCLGAYVLIDGRVLTVLAGETVLATGGAGKAYRYTSNDDTATGDGIAMAYRAGLPVRNMEFYQFHPTCLFHRDYRNFLVTEALRGEGAHLVDHHGVRFMKDYDSERMELAPRDVVARAMDSHMKQYGIDHVFLDATHLGEAFLRKHFPEVTGGVLRAGIVPWNQGIPVVPAAHYCVGGVVAGIDGSTEMAGLRVIGEAASTGLHGANRLGSNSLLEAGVMGMEAARSIPDTMLRKPVKAVRDWYYGRAQPLSESVLVDHSWASLRSMMWDYVGIVRTDKRLRRALRFLEVISEETEEDYWNLLPSVELLELRNLCTVSTLMVRSALRRRECRGLHYLQDCPEKSASPRDTVLRKSTS